MTRSSHRLAPLALVALTALAGCQDYNFSPVNQCLIQPGTERVTLSDISTADILFVVDDSGSMGGEQLKLQQSFDAFVAALKTTNQDRVTGALEPIDFHIAITTTSVFVNRYKGATCRSSCAGVAGQVCCDDAPGASGQPLKAPVGCKVDADCAASGAGLTCQELGLLAAPGKSCADASHVPVLVPVACPVVGQACGELQARYQFSHGPRTCGSGVDCRTPYPYCRTGCTGAPTGASYCCDTASGAGAIDPLQCDPGVATEYTPYPRGDFVKASTSASGAPPLVIHFTKDLFCTRNPTDTGCAGPPPGSATAEIQKRVDWFKANVAVGTCGSPQEQGLEASRRALRKALKLDGLSQPGLLADEWPHSKSKLVTVWVGDEDDCSTPESATAGVIMSRPPTPSDPNPPEACVADGGLPLDQQKRYPLGDFSAFLSGLGRPLASGFIVSAIGNTCVDAACQPGLCVDPSCTSGPLMCGGQSAGTRFLDLATAFRVMGADVVAGSICDPGDASNLGFSSILKRVAEVVKQPSGLQLPTQPASAALTILRIVGTDGKTRKTCSAPAPAGTTGAALNDFDWWFTDGNDLNSQVPTGASRFISLNRAVIRCTANPGETYSADYLGLVPAGGCDTAGDCALALGTPTTWTTPWVCQKEAGAPAGAKGTCLCGG
jgi:hypothetical protein